MSYFPKRNIPTISEWEAFSPTGAWNTNVSYIGKYRRVGDVAEVWVDVSLSGEPNSASLTVNPPSGKYTSRFASVGIGYCYDSDASSYKGPVDVTWAAGANNYFYLVVPTTQPNTMTQISQSAPITWANGDVLRFSATLEGVVY